MVVLRKVILVGFFASALPLCAGQAERAALIDELMEQVGTKAMMTDTLNRYRSLIDEQVRKAILADPSTKDAAKGLEPVMSEYFEKVFAVMNHAFRWEVMKPQLAAIYDGAFSEEELAALVAFYKTPAGKASIEKMPAVMQKAMQTGTKLMQAEAPEIEKLSAELRDKVKSLATQTGAGTPAAAAAPSVPECSTDRARVNSGGNARAVKLIRQPAPVYPPLAKQARVTGHVIFKAMVAKDGTIECLSLVSGHPMLIQAAKDAARQWVYEPTFLNGAPIEVGANVDVNFALPK